FAELLRDDAGHHVGRPGRRKRHHDLDRSIRIFLCAGLRGKPDSGCGCQYQSRDVTTKCHSFLLCLSSSVTCLVTLWILADAPGRCAVTPRPFHLRRFNISRASLAVASSPPRSSIIRAAFSHSAALLGASTPLRI